jgi:hypothetical protein
MMVRKPRNINDVDLVDNGPQMELPISQPTEMSYFLQRLRLAEVSRNIVDHNPIASISSGGPSYSAHIMAMDFELDQMIHDIPSFFNLDRYEGNSDSTASEIFIHAYILNSAIHTQRCKLHLRYLISGPNNNPIYASSREKCLKSAHQLIRAELQLEQAKHPFVLIRLHLSGMLYGAFLAGIALLMDACINGPGSVQDKIKYGDIAEALRIIKGAKSHSWAAANLHESLMQVLDKYTSQEQPMQDELMPVATVAVSTTTTSSVINTVTSPMAPKSDQAAMMLTPRGIEDGVPMNLTLDETPLLISQSQYYDLAQSLEELIYTDGFQWDDLYSGVNSVSFF